MQRVTSDFLQRATSATSNERILQRVTSDFTTNMAVDMKLKVTISFCKKLPSSYHMKKKHVLKQVVLLTYTLEETFFAVVAFENL